MIHYKAIGPKETPDGLYRPRIMMTDGSRLLSIQTIYPGLATRKAAVTCAERIVKNDKNF